VSRGEVVGVGMVYMSEIETVVHILNLGEDNYRKAERVGSHLVAEKQARGEKIVKTVDEVDLALEEAEGR